MLREDQIERYARHILLREVGGVGQRRILEASVELRGLGPIGCWTATWLALAGVGELGLVDPRPAPPSGILPMLPAGEGPRDRGLAAQLAAFNSDVSIRILEAGSWRRPSSAEGAGDEGGEAAAGPAQGVESTLHADALWARLASGTGEERLLAAAAGEEVVVGWAGETCWVCVEESLQDPLLAPAAHLASLAGSLAASSILAAILEPGRERAAPSVGRVDGGRRPLGPCTHGEARG